MRLSSPNITSKFLKPISKSTKHTLFPSKASAVPKLAVVVVFPTPPLPEEVKAIVEELKPDFDYILLDCPAGIEQGFMNAVAGADEAIVVSTPEISSVRDADRVVGLLEQKELTEPPMLVISRIRRHMMNDGDMMDVDEITHHLSIKLIGIVFDDDEVISYSNKGEPIVLNEKNPASQGYRNIARRLEGETVPLMTIRETEKGGFMKKFISWFKK